MENNNYPIINGSYEFTQVYLLYQLLSQLNLGNDHNQNIVDALNQLNNKNNNDIIQAIGNIPQVDLSNIVNLLNQINNKEYPNIPQADYSSIINAIKSINIPQYNDSNVVNAINNIKIPEVDLSAVITALNNLKIEVPQQPDINIDIYSTNVCPQKTIYEVEYQPIENRTVTVRKFPSKSVTPPPKVVKIVNKEAYLRVCGTSSPNSNYVNCVQCVDKWLSNNPNPHISQVTQSVTGCSAFWRRIKK